MSMQFNSFVFILLFLPITTLLYYTANRINSLVGKWILVISSIIFYCYTDISILWVLGISIIVNYVFSLTVTKAKKWRSIFLVIPVIINVGLLLY